MPILSFVPFAHAFMFVFTEQTFPEYFPRARHSAGYLMSKTRSPPPSKLDSESSFTLGQPFIVYKNLFTLIQLPHGIQVGQVPISLSEDEETELKVAKVTELLSHDGWFPVSHSQETVLA